MKLFLAIALAFITSTAKGQASEEEALCTNIGRINVAFCAAAVSPTVKSKDDKKLAVDVCVSAGYAARAICLDHSLWAKYEAIPGCAGVQRFALDSVLGGGSVVVKKLPQVKRKAAQERVDYWATLTAIRSFKSCQRAMEQEREQETKKPTKPRNDGSYSL